MPHVMEQIDRMNTSEKVQVMDYLWTALESSNSDYEPPAWHGEELARREKLYRAGKVSVYDWEEVKAIKLGALDRKVEVACASTPHASSASTGKKNTILAEGGQVGVRSV